MLEKHEEGIWTPGLAASAGMTIGFSWRIGSPCISELQDHQAPPLKELSPFISCCNCSFLTEAEGKRGACEAFAAAPYSDRRTCEHQRPVPVQSSAAGGISAVSARNDGRYFTNEALKPVPNGPARGCTHGGCSNTKLDPEGCRERGETGFLPPPTVAFSTKRPQCAALQPPVLPPSPNTLPPAANPPTSLPQLLISTPVHNPTTPPAPPGSCFKPCVIVLSPRVTMNTKP